MTITKQLKVALLATPDTTASTVYGMHDLLCSPGRDWELIVGGINGVLFAILTGFVAWVWFSDPAIGLVIALAMIFNLVVAGLAGSTIPIMLERMGIDPAIGSSVVLTTVTDVVGFFAFLGLAALMLL